MNQSRYQGDTSAAVAEGWRLQRLTPPSRLFGANGLRTGPDGRIYVAQVSGSQVSAIDVDSGSIETISPMGGEIVAPDDLVFDNAGNLYATEITEGRVSVLEPGGRTRVVYGDMPCANPITMHHGRLFAGECRPSGRLMELDLNGGAPRILLENIPMPNAMEVGPDGLLYFPVMGSNEIWRISLDGGIPEVIAGDLGVPDAVKFNSRGQIVSTQVATGQVLEIDPETGHRRILADIAPGLDNLSFVGDRLFVSSISGQVNEVLADGGTRSLVPDGLQWPLGLAMGADGQLFVADGGFTHMLKPGGDLRCIGMLFSPGFPGYTRGVATIAGGEYIVTTANGQVCRFWPARQHSEMLAEGFDRLYGIAVAERGALVFAEAGTGRLLCHEGDDTRVLASGLAEPMGVAIASDGACLVAEEQAGKVTRVTGSGSETLVDGLQRPQGIVLCDEALYIVDVGAKSLIHFDLPSGERKTVAASLPVGAPPGVVPKFLRAIPPLSGPMGPFAGITADADGRLYLSADAEGSVIALQQSGE